MSADGVRVAYVAIGTGSSIVLRFRRDDGRDFTGRPAVRVSRSLLPCAGYSRCRSLTRPGRPSLSSSGPDLLRMSLLRARAPGGLDPYHPSSQTGSKPGPVVGLAAAVSCFSELLGH